MIKQIQILSDLIAGLQRLITVSAIVDNGDDTWTLSVDLTYYLTISKTVTIDGLDYKITNFSLNTSLTIKGVRHTTTPTATSFDIDAPTFRHGSPKLVNSEHTKEKIQNNKYPFIWLVEINNVTNNAEFSARVKSTMSVNLMFFTDNDKKNWLIEDHYTNAIYPMLNEINFFMKAIKKRRDLFGKEVDYTTTNHVNFGDYLLNKGNQQQIISDELSGVQLAMELPFVVDPCDDVVIICKPVIILVNGVFLISAASGTTENILVVDSDRNPVNTVINSFGEVVVDCIPVADSFLLLETGDFFLLETGDKLILE